MKPCGQTGNMSEPSPSRYCITNWTSHMASFRNRRPLLDWRDKELTQRVDRPDLGADTVVIPPRKERTAMAEFFPA